jgi:hypothetical protein
MIIPLPSQPVTFAEGVTYEFPTDSCCNCGSTDSLKLVSQDTRVTSYWLSGASEVTFPLPLPFCPRCEKTARRRTPTLVQYVLMALLGWGAAMGVAFGVAAATDNLWVYDNAALLSLVAGVAAVAAFYSLRRPEAGQSSYYQPVRIKSLSWAFRSGTIRKITFFLANSQYAASFKALNHDALSRGLVDVRTS